MNLWRRDLVSLIQQAEADDIAQDLVFKNADPDYLISHVDDKAAMKSEFQTREPEVDMPRLVGEINEPNTRN